MNQHKPIRFQMIGGFLGAGKTTTIARLARCYSDQGLRVGIVTNDQAENLVDTGSLQSQGFQVGEVAGACFCCHFDDLVSTMRGLSIEQVPDVIMAEPVGSCTDLVATVSEPIRRFYAGEFLVGPYAVLLKPEHGLKILRGQEGGFSPKAEYIFLKQLEEAGLLVINKIDVLDEPQLTELQRALRRRFPEKPLLAISAKVGQGVDQLLTALDAVAPPTEDFIEVDYDVYADGEAELGWLNATFAIESPLPVDLDRFAAGLMRALGQQINAIGAEIAHLKVLARTPEASSVANLVSSDSDVEISLSSAAAANVFEVIVNARIAIDPAQLASCVAACIASVTRDMACVATPMAQAALKPGRPVPTHALR